MEDRESKLHLGLKKRNLFYVQTTYPCEKRNDLPSTDCNACV